MTASLTATLERLRAKLDRLRRADPHHEIFGASSHHYQLAAPVPEAELARLETERRVQLPAEYRAFLAVLGEGGAGPDYGLGTIAQSLSVPLDEPFPFSETVDVDDDEFEDDERPPWRSGYLVIGSKGCGYYNLLTVTGPTRGKVWYDYTAAESGFHFTEQTFFEWYEAWLDRSLEDRAKEGSRRDEEAEGLQQRLRDDPGDVEARVELADLFLNVDRDPEAAKEELQQVLRQSPGHPYATDLLGRILKAESDWGPLATAARAALPRAEEPRLRARLLSHLGIALEAHGAHREAADALDEALKLDKRVGFRPEGVRLPAARAHRAVGDLVRARNILRGAAPTPLVCYELGCIELELGEYDKAVSSLDRAAKRAPFAKHTVGVGPVPEDVQELLRQAEAGRDGGGSPE